MFKSWRLIAENNLVHEGGRPESYILLGNAIAIDFQNEKRQLIASKGLNYENLTVYARVKIHSEIYTLTIYKVIETNSFTVEIKDNNALYGLIRFFLIVKMSCILWSNDLLWSIGIC